MGRGREGLGHDSAVVQGIVRNAAGYSSHSTVPVCHCARIFFVVRR